MLFVLNLLHKIVSVPAIYDLSQKLAGSHITAAVLKKELSTLAKKGSALDVGGGTGSMRSLLPKSWQYACLDNDPQKLWGARHKYPKDEIIQASATQIPKPDCTYDLCILSAVSHHLKSAELDKVLAEIFRVLRPDGQLLFLDALLNHKNIIGMLLWALDRGRFPRSLNELQGHIEKRFVITRRREWKVFHEIILFWCKKKHEGILKWSG